MEGEKDSNDSTDAHRDWVVVGHDSDGDSFPDFALVDHNEVQAPEDCASLGGEASSVTTSVVSATSLLDQVSLSSWYVYPPSPKPLVHGGHDPLLLTDVFDDGVCLERSVLLDTTPDAAKDCLPLPTGDGSTGVSKNDGIVLPPPVFAQQITSLLLGMDVRKFSARDAELDIRPRKPIFLSLDQSPLGLKQQGEVKPNAFAAKNSSMCEPPAPVARVISRLTPSEPVCRSSKTKRAEPYQEPYGLRSTKKQSRFVSRPLHGESEKEDGKSAVRGREGNQTTRQRGGVNKPFGLTGPERCAKEGPNQLPLFWDFGELATMLSVCFSGTNQGEKYNFVKLAKKMCSMGSRDDDVNMKIVDPKKQYFPDRPEQELMENDSPRQYSNMLMIRRRAQPMGAPIPVASMV